MVAQGTVPVVGRVARAFASLAQGLGQEMPGGSILIAHKITQTDIAGMAGVARENASRAINDLLRDGVLTRDGSHYVIAQPDDLRDLAEI
jgi:CRP-like cAMP-binding protein